MPQREKLYYYDVLPMSYTTNLTGESNL